MGTSNPLVTFGLAFAVELGTLFKIYWFTLELDRAGLVENSAWADKIKFRGRDAETLYYVQTCYNKGGRHDQFGVNFLLSDDAIYDS